MTTYTSTRNGRKTFHSIDSKKPVCLYCGVPLPHMKYAPISNNTNPKWGQYYSNSEPKCDKCLNDGKGKELIEKIDKKKRKRNRK